MAFDEALLEGTGIWLRFYSWDRPSLSLGYFQDPADFSDLPPEIPRVRRPTGGGAILHAREGTLSLAAPADLFPRRLPDSYALLTGAVAEAARGLGIRLQPPSPPSPRTRAARWCFEHATELDLVSPDGRKVFGSAQRRRANRVLHHGSLILERHPRTPFTGELGAVDVRALKAGIAAGIARRLGAREGPGGPAAHRLAARVDRCLRSAARR